jgi:hypothetical protein
MKYVSSKRLPELMREWASGKFFALRINSKPGEIIQVRTNYDQKYPKPDTDLTRPIGEG